MISLKNRFQGRGSLNFVYKRGATVRGEHMSLRYAPSRSADYRLAVVVSRKVSKSAVVRNRIRRRIYEIVRLARIESGVPWPADMVLTVFDDQPATMSAETLQGAVKGLLKKAKIV